MRYEGLPVTPALITWARTRAGISIEEATKTFKRIQAWEDGEVFPTYPQLEQLADAFKVPVAVFFFPEPPTVPEIGETFRTLPAAEFERIPSRVRLLLRVGGFILEISVRHKSNRALTTTAVIGPLEPPGCAATYASTCRTRTLSVESPRHL
jgi:transcriptional regulator with XRE-family HTH domain